MYSSCLGLFESDSLIPKTSPLMLSISSSGSDIGSLIIWPSLGVGSVVLWSTWGVTSSSDPYPDSIPSMLSCRIRFFSFLRWIYERKSRYHSAFQVLVRVRISFAFYFGLVKLLWIGGWSSYRWTVTRLHMSRHAGSGPSSSQTNMPLETSVVVRLNWTTTVIETRHTEICYMM